MGASKNEMKHLDAQMSQWGSKLSNIVKIPSQFHKHLGTVIASEITVLAQESKERIITTSPVSIDNRLDELVAFQGWMDFSNQNIGNPYIIRAQVITEIYVCFVYLGESLFKAIRHECPPNTITKKCCRFLTDNPVRAFRNAIAHANWQYNSDFSGLQFWAKKGQDDTEPVCKFNLSQEDLTFWQALARCVAYASFLCLSSDKKLREE